MKILVCGTSVMMTNILYPNGSKSWVHYLQQRLGCEVVNIARAGCGNQYIHDAVLAEVTERDYDLVLVSWNLSDKVEFRTCHNVKLEDWEMFGGNTHEEHMQRDWIWAHTSDEVMTFPGAAAAKNDLFKNRFKLLPDYEIHHQTMLTQVISLQSALKQYNVPYMFTFYRKLFKIAKFNKYYDRLDFNNIYTNSLYRFAKNTNTWDAASKHPTNRAYAAYAELVYEFLNTKNLITP